MAFDTARIPVELIAAYKEKRAAVLVGAGASASAGLPLWGALLDNMIATAERNHYITPERASDYKRLAGSPDKYLMLASSLKEDFNNNFDGFIADTFVRSKPRPAPIHDALVHMENLQFVLTTNYDTLIERVFRTRDADVPVCTYLDTGEIQRRLARREFFILKAHGDAAKAGSGIILTDADYRNLLYRQRAYQSLLSSMFTMYSLIFVGASLHDPEIKLLLGYIADSFHPGSGPSHYALMSKEDFTAAEASRWLKDFNVQFVPISKADGYAELPAFLTALCSVA
jgi:hypothetical protein